MVRPSATRWHSSLEEMSMPGTTKGRTSNLTLAQDAESLLPQLEAGARGGREHREAAQLGALVPPRQRESRVGADDEDELHPRQLLAARATCP